MPEDSSYGEDVRQAYARALAEAVRESHGTRFGKIAAIKVYRNMTGRGLKESRDAIERFL
ncbi:MAG: hypothetical protein MJA29_02915 [Candidatus Omnitrophica bacterium]|nr:hypothetical protein [Candidatus Omnitrophota bacterium]